MTGTNDPQRMDRPRVAVFSDNRDWHTRAIAAALRRKGAECVVASLRDVTLSPFGDDPLQIPGFDGTLPQAAFVRGISSGTFESITCRLGVLHALEAAGVPVWNSARSVEICVDKAATTLRLMRARVPTPDTWVTEGRDRAAAIVEAQARPGVPLVLKPLFGSQGKGLMQVFAPDGLPDTDTVGDIYYLQRFAGTGQRPYRDYRAFISGGRLVAGMVRVSDEWITNVHQGGRTEPWDPPPAALDMSLQAAACTGAGYAGVDLVADGQGSYMVLEVNSMPAWTGLQAVTPVNIASRLADDFLGFAGLAHA